MQVVIAFFSPLNFASETCFLLCRKFHPAPDLIPWLAQGWEWCLSKDQSVPEIFPGTGAEILFNLGEPITITIHQQQALPRACIVATGKTALLCPRHARLSFTAQGKIHLLGLRLRSSACFDLFGVPLEHLCDLVLSLDELGIATPNVELLIEQGPKALGFWLRQIVFRRREQDQAMIRAIERLYYGVSTADLQLHLGVSMRTFQRRLYKHIGVDARYFLRTVRFQRTLRQLLSGAPLLNTLLEQGYCDQSHFIKSRLFFTERLPKKLLTPEHIALNHYSPLVNRLDGFL